MVMRAAGGSFRARPHAANRVAGRADSPDPINATTARGNSPTVPGNPAQGWGEGRKAATTPFVNSGGRAVIGLCQAFLEINQETLRILPVLKTNDCVIGVPHDDHIALC
jgi:hypothetical protein